MFLYYVQMAKIATPLSLNLVACLTAQDLCLPRLCSLKIGSSRSKKSTSYVPSSGLHGPEVRTSRLDQIKNIIIVLFVLEKEGQMKTEVGIEKEEKRDSKRNKISSFVLSGSFINIKRENCLRRTKGKRSKEKSNFLCSNYLIECYIFTSPIKDHRCVYICLE